MRKIMFILLLIVIQFIAGVSANSGKNSTTFGVKSLKIVSPSNGISVDYSYITIKIKTVGLYRVSAKNESMASSKFIGSSEVEGVRYKDYYFLYNVPLQNGTNDINITVRLKDNLPVNVIVGSNSVMNRIIESKIITINSLAKGIGVGADIYPKNGYKKVNATIKALSKIENIKKYYYDFEGDGKIDKTTDKDSITKKFKEGSFKPMVTVETDDGLFFSSNPLYTRPLVVRDEPEAKAVTVLTGIDIRDMQYWGDLYILTSDKVYILDTDNEIIKQVVELGDVDNPQGFYINRKNDDIYIADTGNNRIIRFLAKNNYQRDESYEVRYDFDQPVDVYADIYNGIEELEVLDRGNNRVVLFKDRSMSSIFTGEGSLNGKLNNPINFFGDYLLDRDGTLLREINANYSDGGEQILKINNINHGKFGKITDRNLIASEDDKELILMFVARDLMGRVKLDCSPIIAIPTNFGEFDKTYFACKKKKGLFSILPYAKPKGARAIDIAKEFAEAIKSKSRFKLLRLSMYNAKLLWNIDLDKAGDILKKTKEYKTDYYDNNSAYISAMTNYKIGGKKVRVEFILKKAKGQIINTGEWFVNKVMMFSIK